MHIEINIKLKIYLEKACYLTVQFINYKVTSSSAFRGISKGLLPPISYVNYKKIIFIKKVYCFLLPLISGETAYTQKHSTVVVNSYREIKMLINNKML